MLIPSWNQVKICKEHGLNAWHAFRHKRAFQSKYERHARGYKSDQKQKLNMLQNTQKNSEMKPYKAMHTCYLLGQIQRQAKEEGERGVSPLYETWNHLPHHWKPTSFQWWEDQTHQVKKALGKGTKNGQIRPKRVRLHSNTKVTLMKVLEQVKTKFFYVKHKSKITKQKG